MEDLKMILKDISHKVDRILDQQNIFKEKHEVETKYRNYKPFIYMSSLLIFVLSLTYAGSNVLIEHKAQNVLYKTSEYAKMDN
mgnify:CR=1 FL=1